MNSMIPMAAPPYPKARFRPTRSMPIKIKTLVATILTIPYDVELTVKQRLSVFKASTAVWTPLFEHNGWINNDVLT